jgi:hypothetical protein
MISVLHQTLSLQTVEVSSFVTTGLPSSNPMRTIVVFGEREGNNELCQKTTCSSLTEGSDFGSDYSFIENIEDSVESIEISEVECSFGSDYNEKRIVMGQENDDLLFPPSLQQVPQKKEPNVKGARNNSNNPSSYAQLFFDPETKTLVTLMEVNFPTRAIVLEKTMERPESWQPPNPTNLDPNDAFEKPTTTIMMNPVMDETRFQNQTVLTECSSISSDTKRDGPELCNPNGQKLRFLDEPIVFSNNSMCFMDDGDLSLYLLHESGDPWETTVRKSLGGGCTETLKKLLSLRSCVSLGSLRHGSEPRWNPGKYNTGENEGEFMAYSALKDV